MPDIFDKISIAQIDTELDSECPAIHGQMPERMLAARVERLYMKLTWIAANATTSQADRQLVLMFGRKWRDVAFELLRLPKSAIAYVWWRDGILTDEEYVESCGT